MATLYTELNNNPYKNIIIPLIEAFTMPHKRQTNPHIALVAANLLVSTTQRWGNTMQPVNNGLLERVSPDPSDVITFQQTLVQGALFDKVSNPYTTLIETLRQQLNSVNTATPNAWVDWCYAVDFFFNNVSVLDYFRKSYVTGNYFDTYKNALAIETHRSFQQRGLVIEMIVTGSLLAKPVFSIDYSMVKDAMDLNSRWFTLYDNTGNTWLLYFVVDGIDIVPTTIADNYVKIIANSTDSLIEIKKAVYVAINGGTSLVTTPPLEVNNILTYTYHPYGVVTTLQKGTVNIGVNYIIDNFIFAYDGTLLSPFINNDIDYAIAWNTLKVPYEATKGMKIPFINPNIFNAYPNNGLGLFRSAPYNTYDTSVYNYPGTNFNVLTDNK